MRHLLIAILFMCPLAAAATDQACESIRCEGSECGCQLLKNDWKEIARCSGHQWDYLIQKNDKYMQCEGLAGRAGRLESPCVSFSGGIEEFKKKHPDCAEGKN